MQTDLEPLSKSRKLESIYLRGCQDVTDLGALSRLPKLKALAIHSCSPNLNLEALSEAQNLERLYFSYHLFYHHDPNLNAFSCLTHLKRLYIYECGGINDFNE